MKKFILNLADLKVIIEEVFLLKNLIILNNMMESIYIFQNISFWKLYSYFILEMVEFTNIINIKLFLMTKYHFYNHTVNFSIFLVKNNMEFQLGYMPIYFV